MLINSSFYFWLQCMTKIVGTNVFPCATQKPPFLCLTKFPKPKFCNLYCLDNWKTRSIISIYSGSCLNRIVELLFYTKSTSQYNVQHCVLTKFQYTIYFFPLNVFNFFFVLRWFFPKFDLFYQKKVKMVRI